VREVCGLFAATGGGGDPNLTFSFEVRPSPVIAREGERDVLNPSVVTGYYNLYSAYDGKTWHTALATSTDGIQWRKERVVLSPDPATWEGAYIAANGSALRVGSQFWYWYVGGPNPRPHLGLARSNDARTWTKEPQPVLAPGPYGSWDEYGVADPYVIRVGESFYMYYLGQDRARRQRLGLARSIDGVRWDKLRTNPIMELGGARAFDENGLGEPAVWNSHGFYWMLYTGRDIGEMRRMGLARSTDGVRWTKLPTVFSGAEAWNSKVMCDATVEVLDESRIAVWFGGGDAARPDENLNGQIGYGILRPGR
jgi:predicted GH43/DUF377 family glycosyl hydrolase